METMGLLPFNKNLPAYSVQTQAGELNPGPHPLVFKFRVNMSLAATHVSVP